MADIEFAYKYLLWLLLILPVASTWYIYRLKKNSPHIKLSTISNFSGLKASGKPIMRHSMFIFRLIALGALIVAFARPQSSTNWQDVSTEGIDIIMAIDISGSMLAQDFKPDRLEASKQVALEFIESRPNDRIGLVVYAGESFTQCPLTTDHSVLKNLFSSITNGMIQDGTAIGLGLANAVNRLKDSDAKSKVVILLTDGVNTAGTIPPLTAAEIAKTFGVRVYTIGVGTNGKAPIPVKNQFGQTQIQYFDVNIDESTLIEIAEMTNGTYFRATNKDKLADIYRQIDELEKSKINVTEFRKKSEEFKPWALVGLLFLLAEFILRNTWFRSIV
ncbi:MAG: VWA domain-containing protein [Flavobacteriales bacterium]|nr:VWA domain-containing protein [Flavobacteriales bacterium]